PSPLGDISVVFDHPGSSTVRFMRDSLMDGRQLTGNVFAQGDNKAVFEAVKNNKNAMGVIGVSWIASDMSGADLSAEQRAARLDSEDVTDMGFSDDIKVLRVRLDDSVDSYQPYQAYILDGKYPLYRSMYMVNTGYSGTAAHAFYVFVTGWRGQKVIMSTGVLPSTVRPRVVTLN
ncbi:MAG: substrate-binding domain-containing protein, partial [Muribaculaceae bacterium]|nr:substrate-binding domain-containing protein [Muribaculaceae bacterium]